MKFFVFLCVLCIYLKPLNCKFPNVYKKIQVGKIDGDPGQPLLLTPYLEAGKIEEARSASEVHLADFRNVTSYSGYFTVSKAHDSNTFFWFFPSEDDYENAPVLLWLQGGPGGSSLFGLFGENGPLEFVSETELQVRQYRWSRQHSVIYIDNPSGTGFSFTRDGYAQNETQIGDELFNALQQFFTLFPELRKNDFFLTGESYAGKYIPAAGYAILKKNPEVDFPINLKGLAIGDGLCDPINQLKYSDYLIQLGMIDDNAKEIIQEAEKAAIKAIQEEDYLEAFNMLDILIDGDMHNTTIYKNVTGFDNYFNYLYPVDPTGATDKYLSAFLQRSDVRAAIHVGNVSFDSDNVEENLITDIMQSVAPWISELLSNYKILFYNGQMDVIVAYPLTINFLKNLNFNGADQYKTAPRYQWYAGEDLAGYVKSAGNMTEVLVRFAGHIVPADQPKWALDLISRFVKGDPLHRV